MREREAAVGFCLFREGGRARSRLDRLPLCAEENNGGDTERRQTAPPVAFILVREVQRRKPTSAQLCSRATEQPTHQPVVLTHFLVSSITCKLLETPIGFNFKVIIPPGSERRNGIIYSGRDGT